MSPVGMKFPLTAYDRGIIALGNLSTGNLDATTRAIFAPMTLTPDEIKTIQSQYLKGAGKENPIIRTALDLATNPLIIVGLVMMFGPWGGVAKPAQLAKILTGARGVRQPEVVRWMRPLLSPFTSFRNLKQFKFWEKLTKYNLATAEYLRGDKLGFMKKWEQIVVGAQEKLGRVLTSTDYIMMDSYARGWHTVPKYMGKPITKEIQKRIGSKALIKGMTAAPLQKQFYHAFDMTRPLMPKLQGELERKGLLPLANKLRAFYDKAGPAAFMDDAGNVVGELAKGGAVFIEGGYAPRIMSGRSGIETWLLGGKGKIRATYAAFLKRTGAAAGAAPYTKGRVGYSIPLEGDLEPIKHLFDPKQWGIMKGIETKLVGSLERDFKLIANEVHKVYRQGKSLDIIDTKLWDRLKDIDTTVVQRLKEAGYGARSVRRITTDLLDASLQGTGAVDDAARIWARRVGGPGKFSLRTDLIVPRYLSKMSTTYAWYPTGLGKELDGIVTRFGSSAQIEEWRGNLMPMIRGAKHPREYARSAFYWDSAQKIKEWLLSDSPGAKIIPAGSRKYLLNILGGARGGISEATVGGQIAGLLYTSALGMNISPVSKNLMQNYITTLNLVEPGNMYLGLKRVAAGLNTMSKEVTKLTPKVGIIKANEEAFKIAFPGYHKHFGFEGILKAMAAGDIAREGQMFAKLAKSPVGKGITGVKQIVMAPFAVSEKFNRLLSFYSGQEALLADGIGKEVARTFGADLTRVTQFTGGTLGQSAMLRGRWAPLRQFMHFPTKFLELLYGSLHYGPDPMKVSTGVIGRTLVGSAGAYTIAKNFLNLDISKGLMFSALPYPEYEGTAFFPFPMVPPAVGMVGDVLKSTVTGEWRGVPGRTAAMLAPAGLAIRRGWRTWAPKYADYASRDEQGRVPVYNQKGALISFQTPMQLTLRGLGIRPASIAGEQQMTEYLLKQREKIRQFRREYIRALASNDLDEARKINRDFQKQYPSLGPMTLKKSDIRAEQNRRQVTRLQRVLRGFPKEYQPLFQSVVEQATLGQMAQGIDGQMGGSLGLEQYLGAGF